MPWSDATPRSITIPAGAGPTDPRVVIDGDLGQIVLYTTGGALSGYIDGTGLHVLSGTLADPDSEIAVHINGNHADIDMRPKDRSGESFLGGLVRVTSNNDTDRAPSMILVTPQNDTISSPGPPTINMRGPGHTVATSDMTLGADTITIVGELVATMNPKAAASRNSNLSINNNTNTDVTLTTQEYDSDGMFAPTSAVFTVPTGGDGDYDIKAWLTFAPSSTGWRRLAISLNNGTTTGTDSWHVLVPTPGATADCGLFIGITLPLVGGDTIRMKAWHTQGAAINVEHARLSAERRLGTT